MQRREAAQRNLNQEDSADAPTCNERILRCLSCQSDFLLPKSQSELTTGQSTIEKHVNHASLVKKRQLSQQMSNESRMSRNSKESSGHYSSRTVSLYEDFALDKGESAVANKINLENDSTQVYLGSPQKQQKRAFEEWKTLNNRSLVAEQTAKDGYFENHLKQLNETQLKETQLDRLQAIGLPNNGSTLASPNRSDNRLAELNTNNLLINERLEPLNLDKNANLTHTPDAGSFTSDRDDKNERANSTRNLSANSTRNEILGGDNRSEHSRNESRNDNSRNDNTEFQGGQYEGDQLKSGVQSGAQFKGDDFLNDKPINQIDSQTVNKYLDNLDELINQQLDDRRNRGHSPTDQIVNTKTENNNQML